MSILGLLLMAVDKKMKIICVTGAAGFIASWVVKFLLKSGYRVRGTVRDPTDEKKVQHLWNLEGANERLELVKADLMDYNSLLKATQGCYAVLHTACPCPEAMVNVNNPHAQLINPSVQGTLNVLEASFKAIVHRVVMTSSVGAMYLNPNRRVDQTLDESAWSDVNFLVDTKEWYCLAKTLAEKAAWNFAKEKKLDLVVINPSVVMGPLLQSKLNASSTHILKYLNGSARSYANRCQSYVDVRDVATAHLLALEKPEASGRYFCAESVAHRGEIVDALTRMYPDYPIPQNCSDGKNPRAIPYLMSNKKLRDLGVDFIPLNECLKDSVESLRDKGFIV